MLFDHDVVADGEPESGAFSSRLGCEERIEHFILHLGRNASAVVADADLHAVPEDFLVAAVSVGS